MNKRTKLGLFLLVVAHMIYAILIVAYAIQEKEIEDLKARLKEKAYTQHEIEYSYSQGFIDGMTDVKYDSGLNLLRNNYPIKNND